LYENVMSCDVFLRHSATFAPLNRGPEADMFSSVAQLNVQWSTITRDAEIVPSASASQPLRSGLPVGAGADADVANDHVVRADVEPGLDERDAGEGAVWPAIGDEGLADVEDLALHVDHAADLEDDDARALRLDRRLERAGTFGVEVGDADDLPPRPAGVTAPQPARPERRAPARRRAGSRETTNTKARHEGEGGSGHGPVVFSNSARNSYCTGRWRGVPMLQSAQGRSASMCSPMHERRIATLPTASSDDTTGARA
jgi:hypothetical protein